MITDRNKEMYKTMLQYYHIEQPKDESEIGK